MPRRELTPRLTIPAEATERFEFITRRSNPRSFSGLLRLTDEPSGPLRHYKLAKDKEHLAREAKELFRVQRSLPPMAGIAPIRVCLYEPRHGLLVTEYVEDGGSLFNHLWNRSRWFQLRRLTPSKAAELGRRLGRWLWEYHAVPSACVRSVGEVARTIAEDTLSKLKTLTILSSSLLTREVTKGIEEYLLDILRYPGSLGNRTIVRIHGDMELANALISRSGNVFILDFADTREGFPWEDVVRLWHSVWTMSQISPLRSRLLRPCADALLEGYGAKPGIVNDPLFGFIRCWNAVCNILMSVQIGKALGFTGRRAARRLAEINKNWLDASRDPSGKFAPATEIA
jgi:aminoglycoside phosphotransferase (APT) family kinase protein